MRTFVHAVQDMSQCALHQLHLSECLLTALEKALKERGIDTMLEEARADNRENDAEYMKPSIKSRCKYPRPRREDYADFFRRES